MGFIKGILFAVIPLISIGDQWQIDATKAQEIAIEQHRPLLIAFLGSDWCPSSDRLEEEILANRAFLSALNDKVVLLRVNISENFEQASAEAVRLKEKYNIDKCPSLVLAEATGQEIAKLELLPLNGKEYASYIKEMLTGYSKVTKLAEQKLWSKLDTDELKTLYNQAGKFADSTFKKNLLEAGLRADDSPYFLIEQYGRLLAEGGGRSRSLKAMRGKIISRDFNNEHGYLRQLAILDFESLASGKHPKRASLVVKPLIDYLQRFGAKDIENAWEIEMKISKYLFSKDEFKEALKHANASLKIAPETVQKDIVKSIEYLETFVQ